MARTLGGELGYRDVGINALFRPDYYEFWPVFNDIELAARIRQMPLAIAAHLSPRNLIRASNLGFVSRTMTREITTASAEEQRRALAEVITMVTGDKIVGSLFAEIPRELFAPEPFRRYAYLNISIPFADGSSITEPGLLALLLTNIAQGWIRERGFDEIIEIGCGSGLHLCCLQKLFPEITRVVGFERNLQYAAFGEKILREIGCGGFEIIPNAFSPNQFRRKGRTLMIVTAAMKPADLEQLMNICDDHLFIQTPRYLTAEEFAGAQHRHDPYLGTTFRTYDEYLEKEEYACVTNIWRENGVLYDRPFLYDVRFVPYASERINYASADGVDRALKHLSQLG